MRNMEQVTALEARGIPVIPATGNNVGFAQQKLLHPTEGRKLLDLQTMPGIYCNGALVKGLGGREIDVQALGDFIPRFLQKWLSKETPPPGGCASPCITGLSKTKTVMLRWDGMGLAGQETGQQFCTLMMIPPEDYDWLSPDDFLAQAPSVLSFLILMPMNTTEGDLLALQGWLQSTDLLRFSDATGRCSNAAGDGVVGKHVHVPGIGPEFDISPAGVNKGSAIAKILQDVQGNLGVESEGTGDDVAVFGDAGNDIELFGMMRNASGDALEPLGLGFRPALRVAMPWANDQLLLQDANVVATMDRVLERIRG
eukprot:TRINITY_DN14525_c0_g1_i1.p1 TRINITY_DN14525_c0_g1~~TRINITY_DN14525_c0_g1_i1.p1  ORF type:complete len:312 (+),score=60.53 TRINITY_DN14525_c0_g1_i1:316-1251(+)